ncbi:MAG TPA: DUF2171 domain-containing protein [Sphingomicrobium sp.]|jgi:hypothetical protein|nr:DUF2171 domain-containing protein [Sphingomicrobium sp.]
MTRNRYSSHRGGREPRSRYEEQDQRYSGQYGRDQDRDDRGWFERAGDEVARWFGDDDDDRRREMSSRDDDRDDRFGRSASQHYSDRNPRFRDEGARRPYTGSYTNRNYGQDQGFGQQRQSMQDRHRGDDRFDRGYSQRDFTGMQAGTASAGVHDPHYSEWRRRHIDSLDRDYDEYRRENQSRFENEFSNWRTERQGKRQMLGTVREHMNVVGADDEHLGTVDKVRGDKIVLTKSDSSDGEHHTIPCSLVDRVDSDRVILNKNADEAKRMFGNDMRDRSAFGSDNRGREDGPHMLERSFSGTYEH